MALYSVAPALGQTARTRKKSTPATAPDPTTQSVSATSIARHLPANELMFIELRDLGGLFSIADQVFASEAIQEAIKSDPKSPLALAQHYGTLLTTLGFPDKATLGKMRVGAAVRLELPRFPLPAKGTKASKAPKTDPEPVPEIVVLVEGPTAESITTLATAVTKLAETGNVPKKGALTIGKTKVTTYPADNSGNLVGTAQLGKLYLVGQVPALKAVLATLSTGSATSLAATADFQLVQNKIGTDTNLLAYVNTKAIGALVEAGVQAYQKFQVKTTPSGKKKIVKTKEPDTAEFVVSNLSRYLGLPSLGGIGMGLIMPSADLSALQQRFFVAVDRKGKGLFPILADAPNVTLHGAAVVPASAQIFSAFGFNHVRLYDETLEFMKEIPAKNGPTPAEAVAGAELGLGFKIRDEFLVGFSGEYGLAFDLGDLSQLTPDKGVNEKDIRGVFYAALKNPGMVQTALQKIRAMVAAEQKKVNTEPGPQTETYQNIEINQLGEISLAVLDDMLVAGRTQDLKWVIDARVAGQTLDKQEAFQKAMKSTPANSMGSYYVSENLPKAFLEMAQKETPPELQSLFKTAKTAPIVGHITHDDTGVYSDTFSPFLGVGMGAALAVPNFLAAQRSANRATAMLMLRSLHTAQIQYAAEKGEGNYASSLEELSRNAGFDPTAVTMQNVPKSGYLLGPIKVTPAANGQPAKYSVTAFPAVKDGLNRTGTDCFYLDETGIIRHSGSPNVLATEKSEPIQ
ncbi:MAG: hypothetical protein K1Y36_23530 [Blastocatellia bacterium]|nr:hypothetical protein [Blastocatellia bacterium]